MAPRIPKRNARFIDVEGESNRGMAALEALRGYAGAPSQASVMRPGALSAYEGGELAGMAEMLIPGASMAKGALGAALAGVIKHRGGNWIPGDVESSISNLLRKEYSPASVDLQRTALEMARQRGYDDNMIAELTYGLQQREAPIALNRWVEGPLTKYIKRDMGTPEDPVRRLADEGILHMGIPQTAGVPSTYIRNLRVDAGFPQEGLSETPGGSLWENLSDRFVSSGQAKYLQEEPKMMAENPWMQKLDPESTVYGMQSSIERGLGLDHLIDELNNAMNPESGLPRNLLLRHEQLQQMGMEKAVRHVDAVNKWRATQAEAAALAQSATAGTHGKMLREYPEQGLKWVELAPPEKIDETIKLRKNSNGTWSPLDKDGNVIKQGKGRDAVEVKGKTQEEAHLGGMLALEGNIMGHCVGGYCPDVMSGKSRIFSLRDAKGEPHVTIEVSPNRTYLEDYDMSMETPESIMEIREQIEREKLMPPQLAIEQIKGKSNKKPKDEYLPFVQDFVRNNPMGGDWADVRDLGNSGLVNMRNRYGSDFPNDLPRFMTLDEQRRFNAEYPQIGHQVDDPLDDTLDWEPEFAEGGVVEFPKITPKAMLNRVISAYNSL